VPHYDYRCPEGHTFEVWQRMSDEPGADCPECGQRAKRLFTPAPILFKGSGFYKTDSRGSSSGGSPAKDSSSSSGSEGSSSSSSSSTPSSD
jgi:putative FmdB family regulatory protein